jgi:hypothetical protein
MNIKSELNGDLTVNKIKSNTTIEGQLISNVNYSLINGGNSNEFFYSNN